MFAEEITPERGSMYSPQRIVQIIRRRLWTIVLVAVVAVGSALGFSLLQTPTYEASVMILVGQKTTGDTLPGAADVSDLQDVALTVAKAVPTVPIAETVVERLNLQSEGTKKVLVNTSAEPDPGTMFVKISYRDSDAERAQLIANTTGEVLSDRISEVSVAANSITATVWEPATLPTTPISPDPLRNSLIALVLGIIIGVMLAFLLEYASDRWNSRDEMEGISGVPTLGVVPKFKVSPRRRRVLANKEGER
jgi:capsular polysaccharide biosynthesis protein